MTKEQLQEENEKLKLKCEELKMELITRKNRFEDFQKILDLYIKELT